MSACANMANIDYSPGRVPHIVSFINPHAHSLLAHIPYPPPTLVTRLTVARQLSVQCTAAAFSGSVTLAHPIPLISLMHRTHVYFHICHPQILVSDNTPPTTYAHTTALTLTSSPCGYPTPDYLLTVLRGRG